MKKSIYIFSNGELRRKGNTLYYETNEGKRYIPVEDVGEILIFGEVDFNKRLLEFLSQKELLLHYFNYHGYYMGTFYPREHLNSGYMVLRQAEHYLDEGKRLVLARQFVNGAVKNMRQVLKYYENRGRPLDKSIARIEEFAAVLANCADIQELMAIEGNIRETYYSAFDTIIGDPVFAFERRTRRPPQNFLNTLISFANSIIYVAVLSEIYRTHLDPRIGYLHATNFRRLTLNLDVAEIFKPLIADRAIFSVIGRKEISEEDFESGTEGISLKDKGKKALIAEIERKFETTFNHREIGRQVSYRRLIRLELYKLEKHLIGETPYEPFVARW